MVCLNSGLDIFLKRSIQTSVVVTQLHSSLLHQQTNQLSSEFNCLGHSDYYIDLNSMRLLLRIELVKTGGSDLPNAESNKVGCVNNLLYSLFSSLSFSLNDNPLLST